MSNPNSAQIEDVLIAWHQARFDWGTQEGRRRYREQEDLQRWLWEPGEPTEFTLQDFQIAASDEWRLAHPRPNVDTK